MAKRIWLAAPRNICEKEESDYSLKSIWLGGIWLGKKESDYFWTEAYLMLYLQCVQYILTEDTYSPCLHVDFSRIATLIYPWQSTYKQAIRHYPSRIAKYTGNYYLHSTEISCPAYSHFSTNLPYPISQQLSPKILLESALIFLTYLVLRVN